MRTPSLKFLTIFVWFLAVFAILGQSQAFAAYSDIPTKLPEDTHQYINLTRNSGGNDNGAGANLPTSEIRVYSTNNADKVLRLYLADRGIGSKRACNVNEVGTPGYDDSFVPYHITARSILIDGVTVVDTRSVSANENQPYDPSNIEHYSQPSAYGNIYGCLRSYYVRVPSAAFTQSPDPTHVSGGARLYEALVRFTICTPSSPGAGNCVVQTGSAASSATFTLNVSSGEGRIGYSGGSAVTIYPSISNSSTIDPATGLPEANGTSATASSRVQRHIMEFKYKPPCNYGAFGSGRVVAIQDHDAGVDPTENNINYSLNQSPDNSNSYSSVNSGTMTIATPYNFSVPFTVNSGQKYQFIMTFIRGGNGINVTPPFDMGNFYLECDQPPTLSITPTCTTVTFRPNDPNPDGSSQQRVRAWIYERNGDGSQGAFLKYIEDTVPQGGSKAVNIEKVISGANNNHGIIVDADVIDVTQGGTWGGWVAGPQDQAIGACYSATCSIPDFDIGLGANSIKAGQPVNIPVNITNSGDGDNAPLYDELGGNQLTITDGGGDVDFAPVDFLGAGDSVGLGVTRGNNIPLTAPNARSNYVIDAYVDYNGRFAIIGSPANENNVIHCTKTVTVYQPFALPTSATPTLNDPENPTSVSASYTATQSTVGQVTLNFGPGYSASNVYTGPITSTDDDLLFYKRYSDGFITNLASANDPNQVIDTTPDYARSLSSSSLPPRNVGDYVCANIVMSPQRGFINAAGTIRGAVNDGTVNNCERIVNHPFVRAYGGDVVGGAQGVKGYIREYASSGAGSGVEFAAIALGDVAGFSSALLRSAAPMPSNGLTFAKGTDPGAIPNGVAGGQFASGRSQTKYWETKYDLSRTEVDGPEKTYTSLDIDAANPVRGKQTHIDPGGDPDGGLLTLTGETGFKGKTAIYVDGDVVITSNIAYDLSWGGTQDIPSFVLIAKGNIYVASGVTQLDGLYVAQNGGSGKIYTCTQNNGARFNAASPPDVYTNCTSKLRVNGAFVADDIRFLRTYSTLREITQTSPGTTDSGPALTFTNNGAGAGFCVNVDEPNDPDPDWEDNFICSPRNIGLQWITNGAADPAGKTCAIWRVPDDASDTYWTDNSNKLCANSAPNPGFEFRVSAAMPVIAGKTCIQIVEDADDWPGSPLYNAPNKAGANATDKAYMCFTSTTLGTRAQYQKEQFIDATEHASESFYLRPELYLSQPVFKSDGGQSAGKYDSIVTLPPIL